MTFTELPTKVQFLTSNVSVNVSSVLVNPAVLVKTIVSIFVFEVILNVSFVESPAPCHVMFDISCASNCAVYDVLIKVQFLKSILPAVVDGFDMNVSST